MTNELATLDSSPLSRIGLAANSYASQNVFSDYHSRLADNTLRRQRDDLALFAAYLAHTGHNVSVQELMYTPATWEGVTFGLIDGFVRYMLQSGYAIGSVNVRLATVKAYCKLATKAGILGASEYALIKLVEGYSHAEGRNVDKKRDVTRIGDKKEQAVSISATQAALLKKQPDTPQGRRDALLMCLLLDHGLRCSEVEQLTVQSINLTEGVLTFYREKVDDVQKHQLTRDTLIAVIRYLEVAAPVSSLLMGSTKKKGGSLQGKMSDRAITDRVKVLGEAVGLVGLSAHDCRHYWATSAIRGGTDIKSLQDAGGWSSPAMPLRYAESAKVANEGVKLG